MVDPVSTAAVAAATLFATRLVEGASGEAAKALGGVVGRIVERIRRLAADDPETGAAVTLLEKRPSDEGRVAQLGEVIAARAAADPDLATEFVALIGEARQAGVVNIGEVSRFAWRRPSRDCARTGAQRSLPRFAIPVKGP
jgi:hypothetical protein